MSIVSLLAPHLQPVTQRRKLRALDADACNRSVFVFQARLQVKVTPRKVMVPVKGTLIPSMFRVGLRFFLRLLVNTIACDFSGEKRKPHLVAHLATLSREDCTSSIAMVNATSVRGPKAIVRRWVSSTY